MSIDRDKRAEDILERYKEKRLEFQNKNSDAGRLSTSHQYLSEVPALSAKIARAIADFNDRASNTSLRVGLHIDDAPHVAVIVYKIFAAGVFEPRLDLTLSVDHMGCVIAFITSAGDNMRLAKSGIFNLSEGDIFDFILDLVEREMALQHW